MVELSGKSRRALAALGHAYAAAERPIEAEAVLRRLQEPQGKRSTWAQGTAVVLSGLGRIDEAFDWLERAYENLDAGLVFVRVDPRIKRHLDHPRAEALLHRLRLPVGPAR